jgi:hypothetical protein
VGDVDGEADEAPVRAYELIVPAQALIGGGELGQAGQLGRGERIGVGDVDRVGWAVRADVVAAVVVGVVELVVGLIEEERVRIGVLRDQRCVEKVGAVGGGDRRAAVRLRRRDALRSGPAGGRREQPGRGIVGELGDAGVGEVAAPVTDVERVGERIERQGLDDVVDVRVAAVGAELYGDQRPGLEVKDADGVVAVVDRGGSVGALADADAEDQAGRGIDRDGGLVAIVDPDVLGRTGREAATEVDRGWGRRRPNIVDGAELDVVALVDPEN